nr:hypothetical protein [uncultured Massilia sp.]
MNRPYPTLRAVLAGAFLLLAGSACSSDAPRANAPAAPPAAASATAPAATPAGLLAAIEAERGAARCDSDAQCHTIGVGAKACGGPERYLAWSSKDGDGNRLKALVQQHAELRRMEDAASGMMSTCNLILDPGATCQAGQCVLRAQGPGGSQAR